MTEIWENSKKDIIDIIRSINKDVIEELRYTRIEDLLICRTDFTQSSWPPESTKRGKYIVVSNSKTKKVICVIPSIFMSSDNKWAEHVIDFYCAEKQDFILFYLASSNTNLIDAYLASYEGWYNIEILFPNLLCGDFFGKINIFLVHLNKEIKNDEYR